ncbi:MAG: complex I NDUFA5 subunit family protein, partial [Bacteroidales bacterium]|nr:complex I NDUFA5 subunit family protein [Bacteroidales bacterium]
LINGERLQRYLEGFGKIRLRQIKYKYFSDKALYLWELCYAFFQHSHNVSIASEMNEYLISSDFDVVFEGIIDDLIGDPETALPKKLKKQKDGKRIDHLYKDDALTTYGEAKSEAKKIFYIGDSKYYQLLNEIPEESVYKQYTYARNLIQWNMDIFRNPKDEEKHWQDEIEETIDKTTEGYGIIPNFFISARMREDLSYDDNITPTTKPIKTHMQCHFENRLFDRDTLLISHYDVNFLYIISLYSRENDSEKTEWKSKVRKMFREQVRDMLHRRFEFYAMKPRRVDEAEKFLKENFQAVLGKISRPYADKQYYSLALDSYKDKVTDTPDQLKAKAKKREANEELLERLRKVFYVESVDLGENPHDKLGEYVTLSGTGVSDENVLVAYIKDEGTRKAIFKHKIVYVRLGMGKGALHLGSGYASTNYVLLHRVGERHLLKTTGYGPRIASATDLKRYGFNPISGDLYMVFDLSSMLTVQVPGFDLAAVTLGGRSDTAPYFTTLKELMLQRKEEEK